MNLNTNGNKKRRDENRAFFYLKLFNNYFKTSHKPAVLLTNQFLAIFFRSKTAAKNPSV